MRVGETLSLQSYQVRFDEMLETIDTLAFMKMDERLYSNTLLIM